MKWTKYGADVLPAWVADMDFEPAPAIKRTITEMVDRGDLGYDFALLDELGSTWLRWIERRHGLTLPDDEIWSFVGALHSLETVMTMRAAPGDGVALFSPAYYPFRTAIEASGRRVVDVPLDDDGGLDADRFAAALDPDTRVVLMSQPHNPVGRVFTAEEISAFADVVVRHDLLVVSDEVWGDLVHGPNRHLPLVLADERLRDHTVTIGSASKAFNISGLRCAVAHVGPPDIREALRKLPAHLPGGPATVSAAATVAAWTECDDWLAQTTTALTARRDQVAARLCAEVPAVGFEPPQATYLAWLDLRRTSLGDDPAATLLDHSGVALSEGWKFGRQGLGFARINFATTEGILDEILDRIIHAIHEGVTP